jgi:hypothetical protein
MDAYSVAPRYVAPATPRLLICQRRFRFDPPGFPRFPVSFFFFAAVRVEGRSLEGFRSCQEPPKSTPKMQTYLIYIQLLTAYFCPIFSTGSEGDNPSRNWVLETALGGV